MRVVCDNCGASYKIPDSKLTREVNKATCRKCGNPILIRRPEAVADAAAPAAAPEERTLITSAAELERQARARAAAQPSFDEGAMDPRPTQVSPDNSHTEATVPRDDEEERRAAGFRPMEAPSEAGTLVQGQAPGHLHGQASPPPPAQPTLVPENMAAVAANGAMPFRGAQPAQQVAGPIPPPVSPQRVAQTYGQPAPAAAPFGAPAPAPASFAAASPAPFAPAAPFGSATSVPPAAPFSAPAAAPPPPFGRQASLPPSGPPPVLQGRPVAPVADAAPALSPASNAAVPTLAAPAVARPAHNPAGDLTFALMLSLLSVFGVALSIAGGALGVAALGGGGTFFVLLGSIGTALIVVTSGRGTRPASVVLSVAGGFFFAFMGGLAHAFATYDFSGGDFSGAAAPAVAKAPAPATTPPVLLPTDKPPEVPPPADAALASAASPSDALIDGAAPGSGLVGGPPTDAAAVPPVTAAPVAAPPAAGAAPPPAASVAPAPATPAPSTASPSKTTAPTTSTASSSRSSSSSSGSSEPARIAPKSSSSSGSSSSGSSGSSASMSGSSGSSSKSSGSSGSSSSGKSTSSSSSSSRSSGSSSLDTRVIATMMNNNKGVKLCFIKESKVSGELPKGVKVKLTIQPSGSVSSAKIPSGDWAGTDFDGCLSGAVKAIQFPPFEGDPLTLTYPFVL